MAENPKKITKNAFDGGRDTDTDNNFLAPNAFRKMLNMRVYAPGSRGKATAVMGNTQIQAVLPEGDNLCIGKARDMENNCFYYCVWNSEGYHTIYKFDPGTGLTSIILQSRTDSGDVDILQWSNLKRYRINHIDIIANKIFTFTDGLNKARKFNMQKVVDKTNAGYGPIVFEEYITAYKQTAIYAPTATYITDTTRNANNLYGNLYKFTVRFLYDDKEESNWSDWSVVAKPANQDYSGENAITFDNNCIEVSVPTGNKLVEKIQIAVQPNSTDGVENSKFLICAVLDKIELGIGDNSNYVYKFYNDGSFIATNQDKVNRNFSYIPRVPLAQSFVKSAMTYTNANEGWPVVRASLSVTLRLDELFLPSDVENELSEASLTVNRLSINKQTKFPGQYWYVTATKFTIGAEVKKGNVFYVSGGNGDSDNYSFNYTATGSDTAATVASYIKTYLRTVVGRPPGGLNSISDEGSAGGNSYFTFNYLGQYKEADTTWNGSVKQVSFLSLMDNGVSVQIIPYGSVTNYGVVYVDDDGRESNAYTSSVAVIRTPYLTEIGSYKRPVHIISINHQPPIEAKYWKLVRTPQQHGLEMLVQKVNSVDTDNAGEYLDLVVGSLLTYQKLHPNTILKYEFTAGDRIRIIKNVETDTFYSGYFETEVLSYTAEQVIEVNSNINSSIGTTVNANLVTPIDGTKEGYIGKNIIIDGFERTIIDIDGINYVLNEPLTIAQADEPTVYVSPNYTIIDRRGVVRIKKIPGITISDNTLVELFKPQSLAISADYRIFNDFGQKFEILNWGTDQRSHSGTIQNQTNSQPAVVEIGVGDAYIRDRELPVTNVVPGTQVLISRVVDPNFSDFYISDIKDLGRVYPQDSGLGVVHFGSRTRYSGNYIEDTSVNGLNDFDNLNRVDNNDSYGDILATRFLNNRLYVFKPLKDAWIPVSHTMTTDNQGVIISVQSGDLLNQIQYFTFEGGIGNNPEGIFIWESWIYHPSAPTLSFVRLGGDGVEPISRIFKFDAEGQRILTLAGKYDLPVIGDMQSKYEVAIWSIPNFIEYLYYGGFIGGDWITAGTPLANDQVYEVTQQPTDGNVVWNNTLKSFEVSGTAVGSDFFLYRSVLGGGSYGPVKKQCINTVANPDRLTVWESKPGTEYCVQTAEVLYSLVEQTTTFVDANLRLKENGVTYVNLLSTGSGTHIVSGGSVISAEVYSSGTTLGNNPKNYLVVQENGLEIFNSASNFPVADGVLVWSYTAKPGYTYQVLGYSGSDATINWYIAESAIPYIDGNLQTKDNDVVIRRVVIPANGTDYIETAHILSSEAFCEFDPIGTTNPKLRQFITKNGEIVQDEEVTAANGASVVYADTVSGGSIYNINVSTFEDTPPLPSCPDRRLVFQICNSNGIKDDNFDIYLNGTGPSNYIGAVDLSTNTYTGSLFVASLTPLTITEPDFTCPLEGMMVYEFDPALVVGGVNTIYMVNTQNNGAGNFGEIGVRNYQLSGPNLINPCVVANLQYGYAESGTSFELNFDYTACCPGDV
jgi:hypothetical protein